MKRKSKPQSLSGVRVLVGRARHQAGALSSALREAGAEVIEIPFIEIRKPRSYKPLDRALRQLPSYDWLVLTSVNGVEAVWGRLRKLGLDGHKPTRLKIAAIGPATKRAIEDRGFKVNVVPKKYVAESVVESLRGHVTGKRVLLARAKIARDVIPEELRKAGADVDVVEAYETIIPRAGRSRLKEILKNKKRHPHIITFTSSSTVKNFATLLTSDARHKSSSKNILSRLVDVRLASIGPITSGTLRELGLNPHVEAKNYTIPGLVAAIVAALAGKSLATT
ncbi:MAG: uroporphyrinogen-III synthase [Terriglobales bacterium]|jgi:uroporphyrinogen-III synthase|nr:uroporphyrinogen-III synthase [Terriglobales bacterium]